MLSHEDNELLTRTNAGTPMGDWHDRDGSGNGVAEWHRDPDHRFQ